MTQFHQHSGGGVWHSATKCWTPSPRFHAARPGDRSDRGPLSPLQFSVPLKWFCYFLVKWLHNDPLNITVAASVVQERYIYFLSPSSAALGNHFLTNPVLQTHAGASPYDTMLAQGYNQPFTSTGTFYYNFLWFFLTWRLCFWHSLLTLPLYVGLFYFFYLCVLSTLQTSYATLRNVWCSD